MRIQHNIMAMNAYRNYNNNTSALSKNLEKLSSGYKINRAGDDAAGLAISEKMRAQITGLEAAQKNVKDGISLVNTAEGAMQEIHDMLNRMTYLATQSANGTYDDPVDRMNLQKEVESLKSEINRIADSANFNGIKLLDGQSLSGQLSKLPVEYNTISTEAGVTLDSQAGKGSYGTFTLEINQLFGTGDQIDISLTQSASNSSTNLTKTLAFGTGFTGETLEEQAANIAQKLNMDGDILKNFNVTAEGNKVIFTANDEGKDGAKISNIKTTDKTVSPASSAVTTAGKKTDGNIYKGGWDGLFSSNAATTAGTKKGLNPAVGDQLVFNFTGNNNEALTVTIDVTQAMVESDNISDQTQAIVDALNKATFDEITTTGIQESNIKFSDLFTATANKQPDTTGTTTGEGSIYIEAIANSSGSPAAGNVQLKRDGVNLGSAFGATAGQAGAAGTAAAEVYTLGKDANGNNFTAGDVFKMSGMLSDGRSFEVELTAGKDFDIGATYSDTMDNIVAALTGASSEINVKVGDSTVKANTIFGGNSATAATHDFKLVNTTGDLAVTSTKKGLAGTKGIAGKINSITVDTAPAADATFKAEPAEAVAGALATVSFDDAIKNGYGTTITIGDKNYEIVADARDVSSRNNEAVVIENLSNATTADVAAKLAEVINDTDKGANFTATAKNNTVEIVSAKSGSAVEAIKLDTPYGDKVTTASFAFDPAAVKENATLTFNDQTYEFVKKGGETSNSDAIAIEVDDFAKATSKELGDAFLAVLKNGTGSIEDDGTITLKSQEVDGVIATPSIRFANNLTLQIGDTSDSYNQLTVDLSDMHTTAMGIAGINIGTQAGAQAAIDVIKNAINYVSSVRGDLGAISNRLDHTANNLSVMRENIQDAESTIRDTDVAEEMMAYTKNNILVQSAQAMLAQANQVPQGVLQLLG